MTDNRKGAELRQGKGYNACHNGKANCGSEGPAKSGYNSLDKKREFTRLAIAAVLGPLKCPHIAYRTGK